MTPLGLAFFVLFWVVFIYSIVLHEIAHGWASYIMGDPTAYREDRLSLNPLKHIDPLFSIVMPAVTYIAGGIPFGGAKPVPVNPFLYYNLRWGTLVSAAAGPLTNLSLALAFATFFKISLVLSGGQTTWTGTFLFLCMFFNVVLGVFNLLPVPPLDGSHILGAILPGALGEAYERIRGLGWMLILTLVMIPQTRALLFKAVGFGAGLFLQVMGIDFRRIMGDLGHWPTPADLLSART